MSDSQIHIQHLCWRAGFGPAAAEFHQLRKSNLKEFRSRFLNASRESPSEIEVVRNPFEGLTIQELSNKLKQATEEERKSLRTFHQNGIKSLNQFWIQEMINSKAQLREKMVYFWHDHFACRSGNSLHVQQYLNILRKHAVGKFSDLLMEVSKSAAIINYLNANQNRKNHPNENFAREVMELYTVGKGNYSEDDIKEAARAFTGWNANYIGEFVFNPGQHDSGLKKIMDQTGEFNGDAVLTILLKQRETAKHITEKIYRFFVNEQPDEKIVAGLAKKFYESGYDIGQLMQTIFSSDWFYKTENIGNRIKSPIDLWIGINRQLPMQFGNPGAALGFQQIMGQVLFNPPNVAGWPSGNAWIDSSSLMYRLQLPKVLSAGTDFTVMPKADDDMQMGKAVQPVKGLTATIRWPDYFQIYSGIDLKDLPAIINSFLLQTNSKPAELILKNHSKEGSREAMISSRTLLLMQCPDYQYC